MPRKVSEECISCGACVDSCPVNAITLKDKAEIAPSECIDCGACEGQCPVSAIKEQ
jgi:ferredoxin